MTATFKALGRALGRAGLLDLAADPRATVHTYLIDDRHHTRWGGCRIGPSAANGRQIPLSDLLAGRAVCCVTCEPDLARVAYPHAPSSHLDQIYLLLSAHRAAMSAHRYLDHPERHTAGGKSDKHTEVLERFRTRLTPVLTGTDMELLNLTRAQVRAHVQAALDRLAAAVQDGAIRDGVLRRVRAQMTPRHLAGRLLLDETEVLVGVLGGRYATREVCEVLAAFGAGPTREDAFLLRCPRFVADYLHRYAATGRDWGTSVQVVDAAGLGDAEVAAVARLWDTRGAGELVNLRMAVTAARAVTPA